jgi:hypothetical protein
MLAGGGPQAFYKWIQDDFAADAVVHVGMHGTVEWCALSYRRRGIAWGFVLRPPSPWSVFICPQRNA